MHPAIDTFGVKAPAEKHVATIKALLKHKPDLTIKNNAGQTPATGNKAIMALFP